MSERLGVLGGTFDPLHVAHLVLADQARVQLGLARVLFCPAGEQPLKAGMLVTAVQHRLAMTQLGIASQPAFELSRVDVDRPGPHYTADTLALLQARLPEDEFYFLMGSDSLRDLGRWRDPARILQHARLAVAHRPGVELDLSELERTLPGVRERIVWVDAPRLEIAATDIRRRVRCGLPIRYLVPAAVETYIETRGLYR